MLLNELRKAYIDSGEFQAIIEDEGISILDDFLENWPNVKRFYAVYYGATYPDTVLCGINPGRNGAGKTGVPFIDFSSLSKLLDGIGREDKERSAQFFFEIVQHFGPRTFFRSFYVTNFSWVGYARQKTNVNYYDLSTEAQTIIGKMFEHEMKQVCPKRIVALSKRVHESVTILLDDTIDTTLLLPHPNWCAFPKNFDGAKTKYIKMLSKYVIAD